MIVIDALVDENKAEEAGQCFKTPNDILRYLWFKHTGFLQIIEPKTIVNRMAKNAEYLPVLISRVRGNSRLRRRSYMSAEMDPGGDRVAYHRLSFKKSLIAFRLLWRPSPLPSRRSGRDPTRAPPSPMP